MGLWIIDSRGIVIGDINKELFNFTDTYSLTISDPRNAIYVLMIALAIDAQNVQITVNKTRECLVSSYENNY